MFAFISKYNFVLFNWHLFLFLYKYLLFVITHKITQGNQVIIIIVKKMRISVNNSWKLLNNLNTENEWFKCLVWMVEYNYSYNIYRSNIDR